MRISLAARIVAAAVVLDGALVALVVRESVLRAQGREVLLPMEAIDPRSLLTGHYAALRLSDQLAPGEPCPPGLPVDDGWLALAPAKGAHRLVLATTSKDEALRAGPIVARGGASCMDAFRPDGGRVNAVVVDIGVDRFHADQDEAKALEDLLRAPGDAPPPLAVVSIGADGRARLKGIVADGRRTDLTWF